MIQILIMRYGIHFDYITQFLPHNYVVKMILKNLIIVIKIPINNK